MHDQSLKSVAKTYIEMRQGLENSTLTESKYIQSHDYDEDTLILIIKGPSGKTGEVTYWSNEEYNKPKEVLIQLKAQIDDVDANTSTREWAKLGFKKESDLKALSKEISKYTEIYK